MWASKLTFGAALLAIVASTSAASETTRKNKIISTLLNAKWKDTPFVLEASEFLAEENNEFFWELVDLLVEDQEGLKYLTDQQLYEKLLSFSSRFLPWTQLNLLKFSLSLRTQSPKIEMFQHIAEDRGVFGQNCDAVIDFNGKLTCDLSVLEKRPDEANAGTQLFTVDHFFPQRDPEAPVAILYADMRSESFAKVHPKMKHLAQEGKIAYVLRHFLPIRPEAKVRLSGYGVELQIKATEYKAQDDRKVQAEGEEDEGGPEDKKEGVVGGFDFDKLNGLHPEDKDNLAEFRQHLLDQNNDMAPMKVWQLQDLSMQAAERIMKSQPGEQLAMLKEISQNFPSYARSLSKVKVGKDMKKEIKKNQEQFMMGMNIQPSDAALFINGLYFDMDYVDIFTIFDTLRSEGKVLDGLGKMGLTDEQAAKVMTLDFASGKQTYGIDVRDSAVKWINNIEKDKVYKGWPASVNEMLRPTFPGMLRSIRKNFFNIIILCDPSKKEVRPLLQLLESFYVHRAPTRIGIVFAVNSDPSASGYTDPGVALLDAFNYISDTKEPYDALSFITDVYSSMNEDEDLTVDHVKSKFLESYGSDVKLDTVFEEDSEYDVGRQLAKDFVEKTGFKEFPQVLMNGVPIDTKNLNSEDFEEAVMMALMRETNVIQKAVYQNRLEDGDDVLEYLMQQPNIMPRLNDRVLKNEDAKLIQMAGNVLPKLKLETFAVLDKTSMASTLSEHMKYLSGKSDPSKLTGVSGWAVVDVETPEGRAIAKAAVGHAKASTQMRVGFVHNSAKPGHIAKIVQAALEHLETGPAIKLLTKVLKEDVVKALENGKKKLSDYDIPGVEMSDFTQKVDQIDAEVFQIHSTFCSQVLEFTADQSGVVVNGKVIGPFDDGETFSLDDFHLLEKFTMSQYGDKLVSTFYSYMDVKAPKISDLAMKVASLLSARPESKTRHTMAFHGNKHSAIKIAPLMADKPAFDIAAVVDPVSQGAQKISALLSVLQRLLNAKITVFLNSVEKHSEMPQKSYFRMVLDPELNFGAKGDLSAGPQARFAAIPEEPIFTMHYHIPDNWLVEPVKSVYDLDNIKLENVDGNVLSEFELEHLLLEGHCFEAYTGNPPRGLQLTLGTTTNPLVVDTIVMANLGYFQLKGNPGRWILKLRDGRSSELYDIATHEGTEKGEGDIQVLMTSFKSHIVKLRVAKKPEKRSESLLEEESGEDSGIWSSITSTFTGGSKSEEDQDETINIFCLASGHLYERLLKIMMLSVKQTTKSPIKFWVLKNFLSPALKEFLPYYAQKYGFEFEYVQYKWPRWLNQQREKQRIIWGYKILFLDVMFPLDVKKIIFVDTDQIVRSDLKELKDFDLKGAPYGYTPFCDSNKDMEGFRFWKQGYWRNHLAGKPYHISALYVVDLVKFRQIAAGDRLRGQYQALSQDPNSLSNLDQDLPNNMIHQVPIKSLPQEWLWCETWCDQASKKTAKSIDLCNNPLTKESKLDAARRIVSEWSDYDKEMQKLGEEISALSKKANGKTILPPVGHEEL